MNAASPDNAVPAKSRRFSRTNLRLHGLLIVGVSICAAAGWFELNRARAGHEVAWVYTIEWPIFGIYGVYIWWRLLRDQRAADGAERSAGWQSDPAGTETTGPSEAAQRTLGDDPELVAWQEYLTRLHTMDPPGQPPAPAS
jgi:hypothetical protein